MKPGKFLEIINNKNFVKYFGTIEGEKLKSAPKGFSADHPHIELLKLKSYLAMKEVSDKEVLEPGFLDHVINVFMAMKPINDFLNNY